LDIAKMNGSDVTVGLIDETIRAHPEMEQVPARTIIGLSYKTLVRTALPTVGFRKANTGATPGKSTYENRTVDTFIVTPRWTADRAIADAHEDGAEALLAIEGKGQMEAAMITMGSQFYYGAANDALGHPGLVNMYDSANLTVDATGSTSNGTTSVWAVKFGPQYCQWVFGNNGNLKPSEIMIQQLNDPSGNQYTGYVQEVNIRPGLQLGSLLGVGRIKNISAQSGKTLNDTLLASLMGLFKVGIRPDAIFMSRQSRTQLQQSRSVTLFGNSNQKVSGKEATIAPTPTEYEGIPIYPTDSILNTEAVS
jgi:hypothetical protein